MELGFPTRNNHPGLCESLVFHQNRPFTTAILRSFNRVSLMYTKSSNSYGQFRCASEVSRNDHPAGIKPADAIILTIHQKTQTSESQIIAF